MNLTNFCQTVYFWPTAFTLEAAKILIIYSFSNSSKTNVFTINSETEFIDQSSAIQRCRSL